MERNLLDSVLGSQWGLSSWPKIPVLLRDTPIFCLIHFGGDAISWEVKQSDTCGTKCNNAWSYTSTSLYTSVELLLIVNRESFVYSYSHISTHERN
jgi:hypothetical protein